MGNCLRRWVGVVRTVEVKCADQSGMSIAGPIGGVLESAAEMQGVRVSTLQGNQAEQIQAITLAKQQARKITKAAKAATFSGWTCGVFGGLTMLMGIFSLVSFLLGAALTASAIIELRGATALRRFDLDAPKRLAINQVVLSAVLIVYAVWSIYAAMTAPGMYDEYLAAGGDMAATLEPIANIQKAVTLGFYGLVILASVFAQGGMALYYITRRKHIAAYLENTPVWAVEMLRAAA